MRESDTRDCPGFDRAMALANEETLADQTSTDKSSDPGSWQTHLETCERCRIQWPADQMLRMALDAAPEVSLSSTFDSSLRERLARHTNPRRQRRLKRLGRSVLLAYAGVATGLSAWILWTIDWANTPLAGVDPLVLLIALSPLALWPLRGTSASEG